MKGIKVLFEDCSPSDAEDRGLPYNAYLVEYIIEGQPKYDIVQCSKAVELFDHYYDKYKKDFVKFTQTEGRVSPKLYGYTPPDTKNAK
jgi:hypothetical protein